MSTTYNIAFLFLALATLVVIHVNSGINVFAGRQLIGDKGGEKIDKAAPEGEKGDN